MTDDVTIPRETAKEYVRQVRAVAARLPRSETGRMLSALADLLDPPQPSLLEEVAAYLADHSGYNSTSLMDRDAAEDILALVRERIAALPCCECKGRGQSSRHGVTDLVPCWVCDAGRATSPPISRRDVLALLGGES